MICSVCGSEFNEDNFDLCPYCLTPVKKNETVKNKKFMENISQNVIAIDESSNVEMMESQEESINSKNFDDDFEITKEDLTEGITEVKHEILIDELGLSIRAVNAFKRANINTLSELIEFLLSNKVSDLKNVGEKTINETELLIEKYQHGNLNGMPTDEDFIFKNISHDIDYLPIAALVELGLSKNDVSKLIKNNIRCCQELRSLSNKDLLHIIGKRSFCKLQDVESLLEKNIVFLLQYVMDKKEGRREFEVFARRAKGETLQEVADNPNEGECVVTRERVRQLESKFFRRVRLFVRELIYVLKGNRKYIKVQEILDVFNDEIRSQVLLYAANLLEEFEYLDFAELYIDKQEKISTKVDLLRIIMGIVGNGCDLSDKREILEDVLVENKYEYIDMDSIINLLKNNNYTIYGDFAVRGKQSYAIVCMYIIKKEFPNGIKLSSQDSDKSEDLNKLREIVLGKYDGLLLPSSDRTLSSALVRNGLILRGRGTYIPEENVTINEDLFNEIRNYIDTTDNNKVFYNEIYSEFEGPLNFLCGIDNYNYLHGALALEFPEVYEYERDYLLKKGVNVENKDSISDRLFAFICQMKRPVSKEELCRHFTGFSDIMITLAFVNDDRLLQWDYNVYSCIELLNISNDDVLNIKNLIYDIFEENNGYASDGVLYENVKRKYPDFIGKNNIKSDMNLHYIVTNLFKDEMDFRRPHIWKKNKLNFTSTKEVALYLLNYPNQFTYEQFINLSDKMKWARVTSSLVLTELEDYYVRISMNKYVKKDIFEVNDYVINELKSLINSKMDNGILPLINIEFDDFPACEFEWNEFVLEAIVRKYYNELDIIQPSLKDRRYQRGVIVKKETDLFSYSQIVARKMLLIGKCKMTTSQFLSFLIINNLARKVIPSELNNSEFVKKEGDYYIIIKEKIYVE